MLLTLAFLGATLFFANKAKKASEENGKPDWLAIGCAATALVLGVMAATSA